MAENFKCSGDCIRCSIVQRQYCASQNTYNTMRMVEDLRSLIDAMMRRMEGDGEVFSTIEVNKEVEEAQKGSGADKIDSLNKLKD